MERRIIQFLLIVGKFGVLVAVTLHSITIQQTILDSRPSFNFPSTEYPIRKLFKNWSWSIVHNTYEHIQSLIVNWVFCIPIRQAFTPFFTITQANTSITIARSYGDLPIDDNDSTIQINVWELDQIGDTECNSSDLQRWGPIVNIVFEDLSTTESELIAPTTGKSTSFPEPIYKKQVPSSHLGVFLHYIWAPVIGLICAILLGLLVRYKKNVKEVGHHRLP